MVGFAGDTGVDNYVANHMHEIEQQQITSPGRSKMGLKLTRTHWSQNESHHYYNPNKPGIHRNSSYNRNQTISSKEAVKYLRVMLDNQLRFRVHVEYTEKKSSLLQATLSQMLSNIGSHRYVSRALLSRVGSSALLDVAVIKDMCPKGDQWLLNDL